MMIRENIRMASESISSSRFRSTLTLLGIIIGVASVITVIGLGKGLRNQVTNQVTKLGSNLIIVLPGKQASSQVVNFGLLQRLSPGIGGVITEKDLLSAQTLPQAALVAPVATINGLPAIGDKTMNNSLVVGTSESLPVILNKRVEYGTFLSKDTLGRNYAVIGRSVAEQLFNENVPIGKSFTIKNQEFIVEGVFEQTAAVPLAPSVNFNNAVVIGIDKAKTIAEGSLRINQILITTKDTDKTAEAADYLKHAMLQNHGGQEDFSVLRQQETLAISDSIFQQLSLFVTWIAAISLIVGGIGITNIMFANVSERTREIGIRKALGATNRQIMSQFITEATLLSLTGGVIGVAIALIILAAIRTLTSLEPAVSLPAIGLAAGVSIATGIISGIFPAIKAAQKDPIESLRR